MNTTPSKPNRDKKEHTTAVELSRDLFADARAYASFDLWMTGELTKLVQRWQHQAAPCDVQSSDRRR